MIHRLAAMAAALMLVACGGDGEAGTNHEQRAHSVIEAFQSAGLEAEDAQEMTREDYGLAPMKADAGLRFLIPSLGEDSGGRVLVFDSASDLADTREYYVTLGRESAAFYSHVLEHDGILVQINGTLPDEQAAKYQAALDSLD